MSGCKVSVGLVAQCRNGGQEREVGGLVVVGGGAIVISVGG